MWYQTIDEASLPTPAVLLYPDRIEQNILRMVEIAGDPTRLRTHVKTHKTRELVRMQMNHGIDRFKCATLSELEMVIAEGGKDILLAYPLLGPAIGRFFHLAAQHPGVRLSVTVDSPDAYKVLLEHAKRDHQSVHLFVDVDNGMHRTGIDPSGAMGLILEMMEEPLIRFDGLHVYDGHIHEQDPLNRRLHCDIDFQSVLKLVSELENQGIRPGEIACGGTPTFPIHATYPERTLCPGTPLLWDAGYSDAFPDLDFLPAAVLAGRVISKPGDHLCMDLGHKAVASEMTHPRVRFFDLEAGEVITHNEEHLVIDPGSPTDLKVGDLVYALPVHICPTMALHSIAYVVLNKKITGHWKIVARDRNYQP